MKLFNEKQLPLNISIDYSDAKTSKYGNERLIIDIIKSNAGKLVGRTACKAGLSVNKTMCTLFAYIGLYKNLHIESNNQYVESDIQHDIIELLGEEIMKLLSVNDSEHFLPTQTMVSIILNSCKESTKNQISIKNKIIIFRNYMASTFGEVGLSLMNIQYSAIFVDDAAAVTIFLIHPLTKNIEATLTKHIKSIKLFGKNNLGVTVSIAKQ